MRTSNQRGFTVIELAVCGVIVAVLATIVYAGVKSYRARALQAVSANSLRTLGNASLEYTAEHHGKFFPYRRWSPEGGVEWWFGREAGGGGEGRRVIEREKGPLGEFFETAGGVEICPGIQQYTDIRKAKFEGSSFGYGYNVHLGGGWFGTGSRLNLVTTKHRSSEIVIFATCAQVNTFQPPATPDNPLVEEFYGFDSRQKTIHFRFNRKALLFFADGSVRPVDPDEKTMDTKMESADVGRFSPVGSTKWLGID